MLCVFRHIWGVKGWLIGGHAYASVCVCGVAMTKRAKGVLNIRCVCVHVCERDGGKQSGGENFKGQVTGGHARGSVCGRDQMREA